jgi:hypothetical protein
MPNPIVNENENRNAQNRLIVLVPGTLIETANFGRQVRWLALQQKRDVIFLAIADRDGDYMATARLLATVEAITRDGMFEIDSKQIETGSWFKAIQTVYRPGDLVVCHEGQKIMTGLWKNVSLEEYLGNKMHIPTHLLSGFYQGETIAIKPLLRGLLFWLGSLVIVIGFTLIEYRVDHLMSGVARLLFMSILLVFESGLIYELNKYTG